MLDLIFLISSCRCWCVSSVTNWENYVWQTSHENGFSPIWNLLWAFRVATCVNVISHKLQKCGFMFIRIRYWTKSWNKFLKDLSQNRHWCVPIWSLECVLNYPLNEILDNKECTGKPYLESYHSSHYGETWFEKTCLQESRLGTFYDYDSTSSKYIHGTPKSSKRFASMVIFNYSVC